MEWQVTFRVFRYKQDGTPPHYDSFPVKIGPTEYVVDALGRIWAEQDRSLVYRHACHHAGCGACALRVDGQERLACITQIQTITGDGGTVTLEPLRNFDVVSDLAVDPAPLYRRLEAANFNILRVAEPMVDLETGQIAEDPQPAFRFENCIECGICVSACPVPGADPDYLGPATLAAIQRMLVEPHEGTDRRALLAMADCADGIWGCHHAFECSEACPMNVDPGGAIMTLRRMLIRNKIRRLFGMGD